MRGASQSDKEDRLSWELPGFFNKYLVKVCDESGTTLGAVVTTENKVEKKKNPPWSGRHFTFLISKLNFIVLIEV